MRRSLLELYIGIICASLVTFRPFVRRYFPMLLGRQRRPASYPRSPRKVLRPLWPGGLRNPKCPKPTRVTPRNADFLELGPKNEVLVSATHPDERSSLELAWMREEHERNILRSPRHYGIIKTTQVKVLSDAANGVSPAPYKNRF